MPNDDITYFLRSSPKRVVMGNQERSKQPDNFPTHSPENCTKLMDSAQPFPRPCGVAARPCSCLTAWRTCRPHEGPSGGEVRGTLSLPCLQVLSWKFQPGRMSSAFTNTACGHRGGYSKEGKWACSGDPHAGDPISVDGSSSATLLLVPSLTSHPVHAHVLTI